MKNIIKKSLITLCFLFSMICIVGCKKEVTFTIDCPNTLYVTQIEDVSGVSSKNEQLNIKSLNNDLLEVIDGKVVGKAVGKASVEFSNNDGKKEIVTILVLEQPNPTSIKFNVLTTNIIQGVEYSFEIVTEPYYAKKEFELSYNMNEIDIDYENQKITFKRNGEYDIACYSSADIFVKDIYRTLVKLNSELETYEILYIGNSLTKFTHYNIPLLVNAMIKEYNEYAFVTSDIITMQWLDSHTENFPELMKKRSYTHVVLQEHSSGTIVDYERFSNTVSLFNEQIIQNGAKTILYETWGYTTGSKGTTTNGQEYNLTKEQMRKAIQNAYHQKAEEIGASVFCSGEAFTKCEELYPEINLYSDSNHASLEGGFLSACIHYATITGKYASENAYCPVGLDEDTANKLKEVADIIVHNK